MSDVCPSAPTLPTMIVTAARNPSTGCHTSLAPMSATSKSRIVTPSAAAFVATAINAVTGVGAPW